MTNNAYIEKIDVLNSRRFSDEQKRTLIVIFVSLFPLVFSAFVFSLIVLIGNIQFPEKVTPKGIYGEIIMPPDKSVVAKQFIMSGSIENMPDNTFMYLVENRENHFWPKVFLGDKAKSWEKPLTVYAKKGSRFSYLLVKVDKKGKKVFDNWLETSRLTGKYPGMKEINFTKIIAKVRVKYVN